MSIISGYKLPYVVFFGDAKTIDLYYLESIINAQKVVVQETINIPKYFEEGSTDKALEYLNELLKVKKLRQSKVN